MEAETIIMRIAVVFFCLMFAGCNELDYTNTYNYHYESPPPKPQEKSKTFDKDVLYYIERNPAKYKGELYAFRGEVIQASESDDTIVFQMLTKNPVELKYYSGLREWSWVNPDDDSFGPSLTVVFNQSEPPIIRNSIVTVLGYIGESIEGINAFGIPVSSLTMKGIAVVVDKKIYYFNKDKEIIENWRSGELFGSVDRSKPMIPGKREWEVNKD